MPMLNLSVDAVSLLHRRLSGEWVEVTDQTRPFYRELVEAGLMSPLHSFARGPEGAYRLTESAISARDQLNGPSTRVPSDAEAPSPRG